MESSIQAISPECFDPSSRVVWGQNSQECSWNSEVLLDKGWLDSQESLESQMLCLHARALGMPGPWVESMAQSPVHLGAWSQRGTREEVLANHRPAKQLWVCRGLGILGREKTRQLPAEGPHTGHIGNPAFPLSMATTVSKCPARQEGRSPRR